MNQNRVRITSEVLRETTDASNERNIYLHPNWLARDIFWQRLERLFGMLARHTLPQDKVLDAGGGSGVFLKALCGYYYHVEVVDLDADDAERVQRRLDLANVTIHKANIQEYIAPHPLDVIVFADVLEHFEDLRIPLEFLRRNLAPRRGKLFISVPTENLLYKLGRVLVRKQKPADHFHSSQTIIRFLEGQGYKLLARQWSPRYGIPIPLFDLVGFLAPE